jgi:hypothetical protein
MGIVETRYMHFSSRDKRRSATVDIISYPADRVLRRRPLPEYRMHMTIDQPGTNRTATCVYDGITHPGDVIHVGRI